MVSAKPIIPIPIFLLAFVLSSISGAGYLLTSIILSRKCIAVFIVFFSLSQLNLPFSIILFRFIEPRLQLS